MRVGSLVEPQAWCGEIAGHRDPEPAEADQLAGILAQRRTVRPIEGGSQAQAAAAVTGLDQGAPQVMA